MKSDAIKKYSAVERTTNPDDSITLPGAKQTLSEQVYTVRAVFCALTSDPYTPGVPKPPIKPLISSAATFWDCFNASLTASVIFP